VSTGPHQRMTLPSLKNGCYMHDDCESCPFEDCQLEVFWAAQGGPSKSVWGRIEEAALLRREGVSAREISERMGTSAQTVARWIRAAERRNGMKVLRGVCPKHGNEDVKAGASFVTHDSRESNAVRVTGEFACGQAASLVTSRKQAQEARAA